MSESLNAGAELDAETFFKPDSISPGELPEIKDDIEILVSLENRIDDLVYLIADIRRSKGMNQTFALEAQNLLPEFGGVPIGYYSKDLSATRLKASLEELSGGIWAMIAAAVVAIIAAIVKFISWFRGGKDGSGQGSVDAALQEIDKAIEQSSQTQEKLETVEESVTNVEEIIHAGELTVLDKDGKEIGTPKRITMHSLVDDLLLDSARYDEAKRFLANEDPVFLDIITRGRYTQSVRSVGAILQQINGHLKLKLKVIEDVARADLHDSTSNIGKDQGHRALNITQQQITVHFMNSDCTLMDVGDRLSSLRKHTEQDQHRSQMNLDKMVSAVVNSYRSTDIVRIYGEIRDSVDIFAELEKRLEALQERLSNLSNDGEPNHNSEGVAAHLRETVFSVGKDVSGYRHIVAELKHYITYLNRLAKETEGFSLEVEKQLLHLIKKGNFRVPENMEHQIRELEKKSSNTIWSLVGRRKK